MASSKDSRVTHVNVSENRGITDDCFVSRSKADAGEGGKRRRISQDYKKLAKQGYVSSMSTNPKHAPSSEYKDKKRKHSEDSSDVCLLGENVLGENVLRATRSRVQTPARTSGFF